MNAATSLGPRTTPPRDGRAGNPLTVMPVTFRQACDFIAEHHRRHRPPHGMKFAVGVGDGNALCGVATVGRPIARHLDDGRILEVTRTCTDGTPNANSMLLGAAWRVTRDLGYHRLVTYTQHAKSGASLPTAAFNESRSMIRMPAGADLTVVAQTSAYRGADGRSIDGNPELRPGYRLPERRPTLRSIAPAAPSPSPSGTAPVQRTCIRERKDSR